MHSIGFYKIFFMKKNKRLPWSERRRAILNVFIKTNTSTALYISECFLSFDLNIMWLYITGLLDLRNWAGHIDY